VEEMSVINEQEGESQSVNESVDAPDNDGVDDFVAKEMSGIN
jgi:hypothetical protein